MKNTITRKETTSLIIIGIYSLLATAFFNWNSSLFVILGALMIEMIILMIGAIILRNELGQNALDLNLKGIIYGTLAGLTASYPLAHFLGSHYGEFGMMDTEENSLLAIFYYKYEFLLIALSLGLGYLISFKDLVTKERSERFTTEFFRILIILLLLSFLGIIFPAASKEFYDNKRTVDKWIPITIFIGVRVLLEIWYLFEKKKANYR